MAGTGNAWTTRRRTHQDAPAGPPALHKRTPSTARVSLQRSVRVPDCKILHFSCCMQVTHEGDRPSFQEGVCETHMHEKPQGSDHQRQPHTVTISYLVQLWFNLPDAELRNIAGAGHMEGCMAALAVVIAARLERLCEHKALWRRPLGTGAVRNIHRAVLPDQFRAASQALQAVPIELQRAPAPTRRFAAKHI
jgi:hypothetical protein